MGDKRKIALTVNGKRYEEEVEVRVTLADFVRHLRQRADRRVQRLEHLRESGAEKPPAVHLLVPRRRRSGRGLEDVLEQIDELLLGHENSSLLRE